MFPEELIQIISKYKCNNQNNIKDIYDSLNSIIDALKRIQNNMASDLYESSISEEETSQELFRDINSLKEQISFIKSFTFVKKDNDKQKSSDDDSHGESCNNHPDFLEHVYPYLLSVATCPFCNIGLIQHIIRYQKNHDNKIKERSIGGYKCPNCNKLFLIDSDVENFCFENTNINLNKEKYEIAPEIDIYSVIVLNNTLKCSSSHNVRDIIAKLPSVDKDGNMLYINVNASYCPTCKRFTILKDDFNQIKDIVVCRVIDNTVSSSASNDGKVDMKQNKHILTQYGYNVQTNLDLSEKQRRIILSSVIEAQILTKREIIDHINSNIERGTKIPSWKTATQKWKDDKDFVSVYQSDYCPSFVFEKIILKHKK